MEAVKKGDSVNGKKKGASFMGMGAMNGLTEVYENLERSHKVIISKVEFINKNEET